MSLFDQSISEYDIERMDIIRFITSHYKDLYMNPVNCEHIFIVEKTVNIHKTIELCMECSHLLPIELIRKGWSFGDIKGSFYCNGVKNLKNLEGGPKQVFGFICSHSGISSLKGVPLSVSGDFSCECCKNLISLDYMPEFIGGNLYCGGCSQIVKDPSQYKQMFKNTKILGKIYL